MSKPSGNIVFESGSALTATLPGQIIDPNDVSLKLGDITVDYLRENFQLTTKYVNSATNTKHEVLAVLEPKEFGVVVAKYVGSLSNTASFQDSTLVHLQEKVVEFRNDLDRTSLEFLLKALFECVYKKISTPFHLKKGFLKFLKIPIDMSKMMRGSKFELRSFKDRSYMEKISTDQIPNIEFELHGFQETMEETLSHEFYIKDQKMYIKRTTHGKIQLEKISLVDFEYVVKEGRGGLFKRRKYFKRIDLTAIGARKGDKRRVSVVFKTSVAFAQFKCLALKCRIFEKGSGKKKKRGKVKTAQEKEHKGGGGGGLGSFSSRPSHVSANTVDFVSKVVLPAGVRRVLKRSHAGPTAKMLGGGKKEMWEDEPELFSYPPFSLLEEHLEPVTEKKKKIRLWMTSAAAKARGDDVAKFHFILRKRGELIMKAMGMGINRILWTIFDDCRRFRFWQKTFYLWTWKDLADWAKAAVTFVDDKLENTTSLYDEFSEVFEKLMSQFDRQHNYLPFQLLLNELDDMDTEAFEHDLQLFEKSELFKYDLLMILMRPKVNFYMEKLQGVLGELVQIAEDKTINESNLRAAVKTFYARLTRKKVEHPECFRVIRKRIAGLKIRIKEKIEIAQAIHDIKTGCIAKLEEQMQKFADIDSIAKKFTTISDIGEQYDADVSVKLNCSKLSQNTADVLGYNVIAKTLGTVGFTHPPYAFFHCGVTLQGAKIDWMADSFCYCKPIKGTDGLALIDVGNLYLPRTSVYRMIEFMFRWNCCEKYHMISNTCQEFANRFIQYLKRQFESTDARTLDAILKGECQHWIETQRTKGKEGVVLRVALGKKFMEKFPDIALFVEAKLKDGGKYLHFESHEDVYGFMKLFNTQKKFELFREFFPDKLRLIKAFCRGFTLMLRESNPDGIFEKCYFNKNESGQNLHSIVPNLATWNPEV